MNEGFLARLDWVDRNPVIPTRTWHTVRVTRSVLIISDLRVSVSLKAGRDTDTRPGTSHFKAARAAPNPRDGCLEKLQLSETREPSSEPRAEVADFPDAVCLVDIPYRKVYLRNNDHRWRHRCKSMAQSPMIPA